MKKFTGNFLHGGHSVFHVLRKIGLSMVAVLLAIVAFGQAQDTYHLYADDVVDCYRADNSYEVNISVTDFVKIDSFILVLDYNESKFDYNSFTVLRSEITGVTVTEGTAGTLVFEWDVARTGSDPFKTIEPNNEKIAIMKLEFEVNGYPHSYYAIPSDPLSFYTDLVWDDDTEFWNDEGQKTEILTEDITGDGSITVTQPWSTIDVTSDFGECEGSYVTSTVVTPANESGMKYSFDFGDWTSSASASVEAPSDDVSIRVKNGDCISYLGQFDVDAPQEVSFTVDSPVETACPGGLGSIVINASGGTAPYTYYVVPDEAWDDLMIHFFVDVDDFLAFIAQYASSEYVNERSEGTYWIAIQDANNCVTAGQLMSEEGWVEVDVVDNKDPWDVTETWHQDATCFEAEDGEFTLAFSGATPFSDGTYLVSVNGGSEVATNELVMEDLVKGSYYVHARDSNNCEWSTTISITEPDGIDFEAGHTDASCEAPIGTLWITPGSITGGSETYSVWWYSLYPDFHDYTEIASVADTATGIAAGVYYIRVFDDEGCYGDYINDQGDNSVKILTLEFEVNVVPIVCNNDWTTATVDLISGDGSHELYYRKIQDDDTTSWSSDNEFDIQVVSDECDNITFQVKDATLDCIYTEVVEVCQPDAISLTVIEDVTLMPTCPESTDGQIAVMASGGVLDGGMYEFKFDDRAWSHAPYFNTFASDAGEHTIYVRDANGCETHVHVDLHAGSNVIEFVDEIYNNCPLDEVNLLLPDQADWVGHNWWENVDNDWMTYFSWSAHNIGDPDDPTVSTIKYWTKDDGWITLPVQGAQWEREPVLYWSDVDPSGDPAAVVAHQQVVDTTTTFGAGTYWLAAKDEWGCYSNVEEIEIIDPDPLEVEMEVIPAECYGQESGQIILEAFNGRWDIPETDVRYEYIIVGQPDIFDVSDWPEQATWRRFTNHDDNNDSLLVIDLQQGDYWIAVRDFCGLEEWGLIWQSGKITVEGPPQLLLAESDVVIADETCNIWDPEEEEYVSSEDGSVTIPDGAVYGGFPPYLFTIDGPLPSGYDDENTTGEFTGLEAGSYTITISDSSECPTYVYDFDIEKPDGLRLYLDHVNPSCNGLHDGLLVYRVEGGTSDYMETTNNVGEFEDVADIPAERWYEVNFKDTIHDVPDAPGSQGASQSSSEQYVFDRAVQAGEYEVWLKDANGCITGPYYRVVEEPAELEIGITEYNPTCAEGEIGYNADGKIVVSPAGGYESTDDDFYYTVTVTGPDSYSESTVLDSGETSTTVFSGLAAGTYTVKVYEYSSDLGSIGGYTKPYNQYEDYLQDWHTYDYWVPKQNPDVSVCVASTTVELSDTPLDYDTIMWYNLLCHDPIEGTPHTATGSIKIEGVTGGSGEYGFMVQGPNDYENNDVWYYPDEDDPQDEWTWTDLVTGHYTVFVRDADTDCYIFRESGEIENADSLELVAVLVENATCYDSTGVVRIDAAGGTGAGTYEYALIKVMDGQEEENIFPTEESDWKDSNIFDVTEGIYIAFVRDANGCIQGGATDDEGTPILAHRVEVDEPTPVVASIQTDEDDDVSCYMGHDGVIDVLSISGGNGPDFTAVVTGTNWNGEEVYKVFSGLDGDGSDDLTGLDASADESREYIEINGTGELEADDYYTVVFYDSEGCPSVEYSIVVYQPEAFIVVLKADQDAFICPDDLAGVFEIVVTAGGVPFTSQPGPDQYMYKWASYTDNTMETVLEGPTAYAFTNTFQGLAGRFYKVWAKDAEGCETWDTTYIEAPEEIVYEVSDISCYDEATATAKIVVSQGNEGRTYQYYWTQVTGEDQGDIIDESDVWIDFDEAVSTVVTGLSYGDIDQNGGHYIFQVRDNMGCLAPDTFITFVPVQNVLAIGVASQSSDGLTVTVEATGGITPYKYQLNGGDWQDAAVFDNLPAGTNTITVMDAHECTASVDVDVDALSVTADPVSGTDISTAVTVNLTFSRDVVDAAAGITVDGGTGVVSGSGSSYAVAITAEELATVTVTLASTIVDGAGNALTETVLTYVVADNQAPSVISMSPTGQLDDGTNFDLVMTLDENVVAGVGNMKVYKGATEVASFTPAEVTISGTTVSVAVSLDKQTEYYVQVDAGFVKDAAGNGMAAIISPTWSFITANFLTDVDPLDIAKLKVYPNPFSDHIYIDNAQFLTRVVISNIAGQRVIDIVNPEREVRTPNLVSGVYVVTMFTKDGIAKTERIVKR
jgi:predicted RNase H-like HicB family nuclease